MQIFKSLLLAGSIAVATSPFYLRADDTEAQTTARAALQQKMGEMNGQAPAAVTQPENTPPASQIKETTPPETQTPPVQKQAPRPVLVPAPRRSSTGQPPVVPPAYASAPMGSAKTPGNPQASPSATMAAPETSNPDLIEQARQATRAKMAELEGQRTNTAPVKPQAAPQPVFQPAPKTVPPATKATQPDVTAVKPAQPSKEEIRAARTREAAEMKAAREKAEMEKAAAKKAAAEKAAADKAAAQQAKIAADQEKAAAKAAKPATKEVKKAKPETAPANFTPLAAPPSSLPASKEQRLQTLLDQYKADKITAGEYHDQRAKIIAEP
jgi:colicin import membrane protein